MVLLVGLNRLSLHSRFFFCNNFIPFSNASLLAFWWPQLSLGQCQSTDNNLSLGEIPPKTAPSYPLYFLFFHTKWFGLMFNNFAVESPFCPFFLLHKNFLHVYVGSMRRHGHLQPQLHVGPTPFTYTHSPTPYTTHT